jgi:Na+/H+-dicarboxylate symporter
MVVVCSLLADTFFGTNLLNILRRISRPLIVAAATSSARGACGRRRA